MNARGVQAGRVKVAALVLTPNVRIVKEWLERHFGFESSIDWLQSDGAAGLVYCRKDSEEIAVAGCENVGEGEQCAMVVLLVDDIASIHRSLMADGIEHFYTEDVGERPSIEFECPSPFYMFSIQRL